MHSATWGYQSGQARPGEAPKEMVPLVWEECEACQCPSENSSIFGISSTPSLSSNSSSTENRENRGSESESPSRTLRGSLRQWFLMISIVPPNFHWHGPRSMGNLNSWTRKGNRHILVLLGYPHSAHSNGLAYRFNFISFRIDTKCYLIPSPCFGFAVLIEQAWNE